VLTLPEFETMRYVSVALDLVQTVLIAVLWMRKPGQDAAARVQRLEGRMDVVDERLRHIPETQMLYDLSGRLTTALAHIDGLRDAVTQTRGSVTRIEEFLRHNR